MGLFRHNEASALGLIVHLTEDPAVRQRKPRVRMFVCGYLLQLSEAYEFSATMKQHCFGWLPGRHWPVCQCIHISLKCGFPGCCFQSPSRTVREDSRRLKSRRAAGMEWKRKPGPCMTIVCGAREAGSSQGARCSHSRLKRDRYMTPCGPSNRQRTVPSFKVARSE